MNDQILVWDDEDGNYWAEGHIAPELFREACLKYDRKCGVSEEEIAELFSGQIASEQVRHEWWRQVDPDNDEFYKQCGPDADGAVAFTVWWNR